MIVSRSAANCNISHSKHFSTRAFSNVEQQRSFLDALATKLNIQTDDDWYKIRNGDLIQHGGGSLLTKYKFSVVNVLTAVYPEKDWKLWKFSSVPPKFWHDLANQRKFMETVASDLGIKEYDDWYRVSNADIAKKGGAALLVRYNNSLHKALSAIYPEHTWKAWKGSATPTGFWSKIENQKDFLDTFAKEMNIKHHEDWYNFKYSDIAQKGGLGLMDKYRSSLYDALRTVYPDVPWKPWRFHETKGYWSDVNNQRAFLEAIAAELNVKSLDDWYEVSPADIIARGGSGFLARYRGIMATAMQGVYPEHKWLAWKFKTMTRVQNSQLNEEAFFKYLEHELNIQKKDDWLALTNSTIIKYGGSAFLTKYGSLKKLIEARFPEVQKRKLPANEPKTQKVLFQIVQSIFPGYLIHMNARHPDLRYTESGHRFELDVFIPYLGIAFEYQGEGHYKSHPLAGLAEAKQHKDSQKKRVCLEEGITLIEVPFWWDAKRESLIATVQYYRPDILIQNVMASPISPEMPDRMLYKLKTTPPDRPHKYPFELLQGRGQAHCFGCKTVLPIHEPRLVHYGGFTSSKYYPPHPATFNFCVKLQCIEQARKEHDSKNVKIANFDGIVFTSPELAKKITIPGVTFVHV